jgi:hypothetical protein
MGTDRVAMTDGITSGSAFQFQIDTILTTGQSVTSPGQVLVWYPVAEAHLPRPGRHVLVLKMAERRATGGQPLYDFVPLASLPLDNDNRVQLTCNGKTATTELEQLRTSLASR